VMKFVVPRPATALGAFCLLAICGMASFIGAVIASSFARNAFSDYRARRAS
jgi:hypothetical protein